MDIAGLLTDLIRAELDLPESARQPFRPGEVLQLRVLEVVSDNRARVDLGRFQAVAEIQFPVAPGDMLEVEVEKAGRQLRLRTIAPDHPSARQPAPAPSAYILTRHAEPLRRGIDLILAPLESGHNAAGQIPPRVWSALKSVAAHLEPLHPGGDVATLALRVKDRVESSGLFFEKKLEQIASEVSRGDKEMPPEILQRAQRLAGLDLKAQLIVLKQYIQSPTHMFERVSAEGLRQLNRGVSGMLSEIVDQQANTRRADPTQPYHVILFDLPLRDSRPNGVLKMYFPRKGRGGDPKGFRLSLLLSLDPLGDIRSDLVLRERDLAVMFFVGHRRTEAHVKAHLEQIKKALSVHFPRVAVSVTRAEQKLEEFETDFLQAPGDGQIDVRI